jgi:ABC-type spermidine/putrescine transport system permease subunit II
MSEWAPISAAIAGILIVVGIVVGILVAFVAWRRRKEGRLAEPDYRAFFVMGIVLVPVGTVFMFILLLSDIPFVVGMPLVAMGLVYLTIGLANRDKWKTSR